LFRNCLKLDVRSLDAYNGWELKDEIRGGHITEISRKYNDNLIRKIIVDSELKIISKITDSREYFADYILEK